MKHLRTAALILLPLTVFAAGSIKFKTTWKNPAAAPIGQAEKIAIFVVNPDLSMRTGPEETLAREIRKGGRDCVAGYTFLPVELNDDHKRAKEFLKQAGITRAILIRLLSDEERETYVPGTAWYTSAYYPTFSGYWVHGWSTFYSPGYMRSDRVVSMETVVYSIETDELLWAGLSETKNPKNDIRKLVHQFVKEAVKKMRKDGLIPD